MEGTEVRKLAALEDAHWWYRERRHLLARAVEGLTPGRALDVGAAGGGNTRVLQGAGWSVAALEYGADGAEVAAERQLAVVRGDATALPVADDALDLVVAFDVLEHIVDDAAAVAEVRRVLRPQGRFLIAVPADPRLWSDHDVAVHARYAHPGAGAGRLRGDVHDVVERPAATDRRTAPPSVLGVGPGSGAPSRQRRAAGGRDAGALSAGEVPAGCDSARRGPSTEVTGPVNES